MKRVVVLGCCGAGKSRFAQLLSERTGLPAIHLDQQYFSPNWVEPDPALWDVKLAGLVAQPSWIMDGTHLRTLPMRLARADTAILLDVPPIVCLARIFCRVAKAYGRVRDDTAPGCPEKLDFEFLWFVVRYNATHTPGVRKALASFPGDVVVLRSNAEVDRYLTSAESRVGGAVTAT